MASRLALKYGLVSEEERLSNSSDALIVTEPTTGSKARTKGSLYLIVTSRLIGGRTRDACQLVADFIRREYYYDESAGIAIVLEKAIRAANRRLRNAREGSGLAPGSIGVALAVVRNNELYVATAGDASAYLVRSARLLMPEQHAGDGLPADDDLNVGVWRGEFAVGDSLILAARNLVEAVGTEELKNAVVTLHPQSAVEHLHHLFVAAGGEGSDAVLAIEASEVSLSRVEHRLVPVTPAEPLAGVPEHSPIPLADQVAGAATAVRDRAGAARVAFGEGISASVSRLLDLMPRRRMPYRRFRVSSENERDTQRRAIVAIVAFIGVAAVLVLAVWYLGPFRDETPVDHVSDAQAALAEAQANTDQVFGATNLIETDPARAQALLETAWNDLEQAREGGDQLLWQSVHSKVVTGLDQLYATHTVTAERLYSPPAGATVSDVSVGPDAAAYAIVGASVVRIDPETGTATAIVAAGEGAGQGIAQPRLLAHGGPDLLILDTSGNLWRWRPSDTSGNGTLGQVRVAGDQSWTDIVDLETFIIDPARPENYRLYVPYPPSSQILKYEPTADGGGYLAPAPYFVGESEDVAAFRDIYIDGDIYAVTAADVLRYFSGRQTSWTLDQPPDNDSLRPGHSYALMGATGTRGSGQLFIWDEQWSRILVYDKADASYVEQFMTDDPASLSGIGGMYVVDRGQVQGPLLIWSRPDGVYQAVLSDRAVPAASPSPSASAPATTSPAATASPAGSVSPGSGSPGAPTAQPTVRPRRTPRAGAGG